MKARLIGVLSVWLMTMVNLYCQQLDTSVARALDGRLAEYFKAIEREGSDVKKGECDFLIETCSDSLMRQHVALKAYRHYRDSKVMGDEAVAIHVYDEWFGSGKVAMPDDMERMGAKVFAEFNRSSLVGCQAPELLLTDMEMRPVSLFGDASGKRYAILYFYDASCVSCKAQTLMLDAFLKRHDYPIDLYAVYVSDDEAAWRRYVTEHLNGTHENTSVYHLWDPDAASDFQRKYGVIQTPRIFLVNPKGIITGRGLDVPALSVMLEQVFSTPALDYGSEESMALYDGIFGSESPSEKEVKDVVDYIAEGTLEEGEYNLFRQMAGDLLYYLASRSGEGCREGLDYLIEEYILNQGDVWKTADDSLKVIGMAEMFGELLSRTEPGTLVPDIRIRGEYVSSGKEKVKERSLRKLGGRTNVIIFYTEGCNVCAAEKEAARRLAASDRKTRIFMVNVDEVLSSSPDLAVQLFDRFDLSSLPFIIITDRKGHIYRRYVSFQ